METMGFNGISLLKSASLALILSLGLPVGGAMVATPAAAATLPVPYVSRALDAVLIPVDAGVTSAFGLAAGTTGVLVLATQPGGLADTAGILPGDVIDFVSQKPVRSPIELDEMVYYWLLQGVFDFDFRGLRDGSDVVTTTLITLESWEEVIEITEVTTWSSYSYESFSYEEYSVEYSEEIVSSYEESSTLIEETVTSEEYSAEMTSEEATDEMVTEESTDETATEEAATDEVAADEAVDQSAAEEEAIDCPDGEVIDGQCVAAEAPQEDVVEEEPAEEPAEEETYEEPVDEGGDEIIEE
ncbi:MAG: endopeptidase [Rhodobacteraceae bacterium PARR1]|nr:MAG: endopeptidase [Rhodobacteraceae bacterium PARR1]